MNFDDEDKQVEKFYRFAAGIVIVIVAVIVSFMAMMFWLCYELVRHFL